MVKVKILKPVGPYHAGQEVEVDDATAKVICDGIKAMAFDDFQKLDAVKKDPKNLTVHEMNELGVKNVVGKKENPDHAIYAETESAALAGKPVAAGEPITVTGGVTPPTTVFPAMAKAMGHEVTELKGKAAKEAKESKEEKKK